MNGICVRLRVLMSECQVPEDSKEWLANIRLAASGDCQFNRRGPAWQTCRMHKQARKTGLPHAFLTSTIIADAARAKQNVGLEIRGLPQGLRSR